MSYTPTTEEVRRLYVRHCSLRGQTKYPPLEELEDEFDRWLAALIREAKAEAWDEGYWQGINGHTGPGNPYRDCGAVEYREGSET